MPSSLNPNHPTSQLLEGNWQVIAAALVSKAGGHVVLSLDDISHLGGETGLAVQELDDGLHLTLITAAEARRLAKENGGQPT